MSIESLLEEYLNGSLALDLDKLDNFQKMKYVKSMDLLDAVLKSVNSLFTEIDKLKVIREKFK